MIPTKYPSYHNIFLSNSVVELLKYTSINNDPINLVGNFLSYPLALQYCSSTRKIVAFNYLSKVSIT